MDNHPPPSGLNALHVLAQYWEPDLSRRTEVGELVRSAKDGQDPVAADRLADMMADLARDRLGSLSPPVIVGAVPARPVPPVHLPTTVSRAIAAAGVGDWAPDLITRHRPSVRVRDVGPDERPELVRAAGYEVAPGAAAATVVVVDDVILTGTTLGHVAARVRAAGASTVVGMVIARSARV